MRENNQRSDDLSNKIETWIRNKPAALAGKKDVKAETGWVQRLVICLTVARMMALAWYGPRALINYRIRTEVERRLERRKAGTMNNPSTAGSLEAVVPADEPGSSCLPVVAQAAAPADNMRPERKL